VLFGDVTGGGVYRNGKPIVPKRRGTGGLVDALIDVPADFVSSLSFSGHDVLITTVGTVFRGRSDVAGLAVAPAAAGA
jgi:hypothetical protein